MGIHDYDGHENEGMESYAKKLFKEFDCPNCDANNPWDDGFCSGDEVRCFYCGCSFKVAVSGNNRLIFKEL